ncbi:MAG: MBL fold metallo-hydrolase [Boseongicola sp.]|nr:MBL fold metallo-hydrolase [Silicimonas sp.]NND21866.1 MBL fold metallo-hydrolase [Silicimonas sp.]NNF92719.1 MBL fold metallo-hydrolase [Boseongicola sp.]NNL34537.1 MBL fold metallo-hydrolase [Silicimonas sp.]RZW11819.1 MAG: MBL fold metallo-hydrolase [Paracoccaceae bacterium]
MRGFVTTTLVACLMAGSAIAQSGDVKRSLTQITDDVWRFDNNFHASLVVITEDGAVVGDPINAEAAAWLETEIGNQFGKDVTYVLASHSHGDHSSGGEVLADTATIVAHKNYQKAVGGDFGPTEPADILFDDALTLEHGGKTFELTYIGEGHGDDMVVTVVRPDNVAFVVDVVSPGRLPYQKSTAAVDGMIDQIKVVESLDFDILLPGHAKTGTKADATEAREYLEALRARVQAEIDAGKSDEEIIASLQMPEYTDWANYEDWLPLNVEGVLSALR